MIRYFHIAFSLLFALSCQETPLQPGETRDLIPLSVGNYWVFEQTNYDSLGNMTSIEPHDTIEIVGDTTIGGIIWSYKYYLGVLLAYRNSPAGILIRLVSKNSDATVKLIYKFPAEITDTYPYPVVWFGVSPTRLVDSLYQCFVMARDTLVTVPAGSFQCYKYRYIDIGGPYLHDVYIAPEHGWVKTETYVTLRSGTGYFLKSIANAIEININ